MIRCSLLLLFLFPYSDAGGIAPRGGCDMYLYSLTFECGNDQICVAPNATSYTCPPNMQLEAKFTQFFETINNVKCEGNRFVVVTGYAKEEHFIPVQFRCSKIRDLCTERNPLVSQCDPDDYLCGKAVFDDVHVVTCNDSAMVASSTGQVDTIEELRCDAVTGKWAAKKSGEMLEVQRGSNVYCQFRECIRTKLFKRCGNDEEHCVEIVQERNSFRCPGSATLWTTLDDEMWAELANVGSITCQRGNWMIASETFLDLRTTGVKCLALSASERTGVAVYVTVGILLFLVILIAGLVIFCRLTGRGWLHQIILKKLRGDKNTEKGSESKKSSSKKDSSSRFNTQSPNFLSPNGQSPIISPIHSSPKTQRKDKFVRPKFSLAKQMQKDFKRKKLEGHKDEHSSWEGTTDDFSTKGEKETVVEV